MTASKHHYIPKCYLKAWTGADGMLCEYRQPYQTVVTHRRHPSETGWLDKGYTIKQFPVEREDVLETVLFFRIDQEAENALSQILAGNLNFSPALRNGLSRFLMSLMHRNPPKIEDIRQRALRAYEDGIGGFRERYSLTKSPEDPESFDEYAEIHKEDLIGSIFAATVRSVCDSKNIGPILNSMQMSIHTLESKHRFLTSDRPLLTVSRLRGPDATLILPVSPKKLLCCTSSSDVANRLRRELHNGSLLDTVNENVVRRAHRYVYGVCEDKIDFVREHFGKTLPMPWDAQAA